MSVPHTFTPGTTINSTQVNANFAATSVGLVSSSITVNSSTTASALGYTSLNVVKGGGFVVGAGATLTIDVPFSAGPYQVFSGAGSVVFTAATTVKYDQWGANIGYADIIINGPSTVMDHHAVEDWKVITPDTANLGYCSFDAKPTVTGSNQNNHLVGYQARCIYNSSGDLTLYMHGYDTNLSHTGSGTILSCVEFYAANPQGTGPITNNFGVFIESMTRGGSNWGIFSDAGNKHMLGGPTGYTYTGVTLTNAVTFYADVLGKAISYGYGTSGTGNYGEHDFYDGKTGLIATINNNGITTPKNVTVGQLLNLGTYTWAALPVATPGSVAYCSDGRKVGESAGNGTGVPVYYSDGSWRVFSTDAVVSH